MRNGLEKQKFLLNLIVEKNSNGTISELWNELQKDLFYEIAFIENKKPKKKKIAIFGNIQAFARNLKIIHEREEIDRKTIKIKTGKNFRHDAYVYLKKVF